MKNVQLVLWKDPRCVGRRRRPVRSEFVLSWIRRWENLGFSLMPCCYAAITLVLRGSLRFNQYSGRASLPTAYLPASPEDAGLFTFKTRFTVFAIYALSPILQVNDSSTIILILGSAYDNAKPKHSVPLNAIVGDTEMWFVVMLWISSVYGDFQQVG